MNLKKLATVAAMALFVSGTMATASFAQDRGEVPNPPGPPDPVETPYPGQTLTEEEEQIDADIEQDAGIERAKEVDRIQTPAQTQAKFDVKAANDLEGMPILNDQGQQIGEVQKVLVDMDQGELAYVVVSRGGVLGVGDEKYVVPWQAIKADPQQNGLVVIKKAEDLREAPAGDEFQIDRQTGEDIHLYYGVSPYWGEEADK